MGIRNAQATLDMYVEVQNDLLTGKIASYTIGDRTITLQNMKELEEIIQRLENVIIAGIPIIADMGGISGFPPSCN
jgi:hypothetical protein